VDVDLGVLNALNQRNYMINMGFMVTINMYHIVILFITIYNI
jgi:hypothetical protein